MSNDSETNSFAESQSVKPPPLEEAPCGCVPNLNEVRLDSIVRFGDAFAMATME